MSTLLFLGLAVAYIPAGALIDRYGQRPVLIGSRTLIVLGSVLLPLIPDITWILLCRFITGIGAGGAFVAGAGVAAGMGKHAPLAQGLYGGSVQIDSGLGLLVTPLLYDWLGWRGAFLFWGLLGISAIIAWLLVTGGQQAHTPTKVDIKAGLRSPSVWTLGLSHSRNIRPGQRHRSMVRRVSRASIRPDTRPGRNTRFNRSLIGHVLPTPGRHFAGPQNHRAIPLLRVGTIMGFAGVALLAIPLRFPPLAAADMGLIAIGATIPYTSVFNEAAHLRGVGRGIAQGLVSIISSPTVLLGPPIIGFLFEHTGNFIFAFGSILIFSIIAITASFLAGPAVKRETTLVV